MYPVIYRGRSHWCHRDANTPSPYYSNELQANLPGHDFATHLCFPYDFAAPAVVIALKSVSEPLHYEHEPAALTSPGGRSMLPVNVRDVRMSIAASPRKRRVHLE